MRPYLFEILVGAGFDNNETTTNAKSTETYFVDGKTETYDEYDAISVSVFYLNYLLRGGYELAFFEDKPVERGATTGMYLYGALSVGFQHVLGGSIAYVHATDDWPNSSSGKPTPKVEETILYTNEAQFLSIAVAEIGTRMQMEPRHSIIRYQIMGCLR